MSHVTTIYYRYLSSITINNPGSGYQSAPVITVVSDTGTGATAVATIFNGQIDSITVTNPGANYIEIPTLTIAGGGGTGAQLTAVISFASGLGDEYDITGGLLAEQTLPEFIREDYPTFVTFIKKYYEFMDNPDNPLHVLLNNHYYDIDSLNGVTLDKMALELAYDFPKVLEIDRKFLYKNIKNIYESKGSKRSILAFFRLLYNEEVEVYYPSANILRASDGQWIEEKSISVVSGYNNYEVLNLTGIVADIRYFITVGSITTIKNIPIEISSVYKLSYTNPQTYELSIALPAGTTDIPGPGAGALATVTIVAGVITDTSIVDAGSGYLAAPIIEIYDVGGGTGADLRAIVEDGEISEIVINSGGINYVDETTNLTFNTDPVRTFITLRNDPNDEILIKAYLQRKLSAVVSETYTDGGYAGFKIGEFFAINESGDDGRIYATDYFLESYTLITGQNGAYIRVASVDANGVPTSWDIINPGRGFLNETATIEIISLTGKHLDVTLTTGYLYSYPGRYLNDRGKLSDVNRLQDNNKYQSYSYIIKSTIPQSKWISKYREILHPAGLGVFSDLIIRSDIDFSVNIAIEETGIHFYLFEHELGDRVVITSQTVALDFTKNLIDLTVTTEAVAFLVYKVLLDSVVSSQTVALDFNKTVTDTTTNSDIFVKTFHYVTNDTASASDVFSRVVAYYRAPTDFATLSQTFSFDYATAYIDSVQCSDLMAFVRTFNLFSISEIFDFSAIDIDKILSSPTTVSDSLSLLTTLVENNIATTSQIMSFVYFANPVDDSFLIDSLSLVSTFIIADNATTPDAMSINNMKPAEDAATVSEAFTLNAATGANDNVVTGNFGLVVRQNYANPRYFYADFVGSSYLF